ncbi:hypothetical protein CGC20_8575 [Leishmania donovani]|uniref:Uncharacterized protein n=1 Tax=Leishmania donovani TaxID=5661 RepID=A0A504X6I9_LEIDO|nr:hypothetical protein CGC20_8575 [Leishmania donovani]
MLYCHHALVGTAATGCGRLACSCRTECEGVELGLDLLRTQHQRRRHRQSSVAAAAHSLSLLTTLRTGLTAPVSGPWELVHNDVAGTLAKPAMPGAPTPTAWIADPATGLTRQADSPRYGTTRCDTRSLPASIRGLLEARSVARFALWSCAQ